MTGQLPGLISDTAHEADLRDREERLADLERRVSELERDR